MTITTKKVLGFSCWAPYLVNGDTSGFSEQELDMIEAWMNDNNITSNAVDADEIGFTWNVYAGLGGDASIFTFLESRK